MSVASDQVRWVSVASYSFWRACGVRVVRVDGWLGVRTPEFVVGVGERVFDRCGAPDVGDCGGERSICST